jgi:DNA invertase Pin-like site-specific DNA recombinase
VLQNITFTHEVRDVALYARKSRGESDQDLEKHLTILRDICIKNNWRYVEYIEIANSETIEFRPKFKQLLKDVEDELFDAVLVVDYDRLGRGDLEDQAVIKRCFRDSNTLVITPEKVYNLSDETDDLLVDVKGLLARQEYKMIKKRLARGKKIGARLGKWTNGTPPFPYMYDPIKKGLVVDENKREIYTTMKKMFLNGDPYYKIATYLNKLGISSPRGSFWHENTVRRILLDETHMGRIISNKTEGSAHKNKKAKPLKKIPKEEWIVVENCHEALKTPEEHNEILAITAKRSKFHPSARRGAFIFSGIIYCKKCNKAMQMQRKPNGKVLLKPCNKLNHFGDRCSNRGHKIEDIIDTVIFHLTEYEKKLLEEKDYDTERIDYQVLIDFKMKDIEKHNKAIERIKDLYEEGEYTKEEYNRRIESRKKAIEELQAEIANYNLLIKKQSEFTLESKITKIKRIVDLFKSGAEENEINLLLKEIIDKIYYLKNDAKDIPQIEVVFII